MTRNVVPNQIRDLEHVLVSSWMNHEYKILAFIKKVEFI